MRRARRRCGADCRRFGRAALPRTPAAAFGALPAFPLQQRPKLGAAAPQRTVYCALADPELTSANVSIEFMHAVSPAPTVGWNRREVVKRVFCSVMERRFRRLSKGRAADGGPGDGGPPPFLTCGVSVRPVVGPVPVPVPTPKNTNAGAGAGADAASSSGVGSGAARADEETDGTRDRVPNFRDDPTRGAGRVGAPRAGHASGVGDAPTDANIIETSFAETRAVRHFSAAREGV